jgi:hypothetical protein
MYASINFSKSTRNFGIAEKFHHHYGKTYILGSNDSIKIPDNDIITFKDEPTKMLGSGRFMYILLNNGELYEFSTQTKILKQTELSHIVDFAIKIYIVALSIKMSSYNQKVLRVNGPESIISIAGNLCVSNSGTVYKLTKGNELKRMIIHRDMDQVSHIVRIPSEPVQIFDLPSQKAYCFIGNDGDTFVASNSSFLTGPLGFRIKTPSLYLTRLYQLNNTMVLIDINKKVISMMMDLPCWILM